MALTQDISVARAVFTSSLLRSETGTLDVSREDATIFAKTLLKTLNICTAANVKLCKSFIVKYLVGSHARLTALGKYLTTLSKFFGPSNSNLGVNPLRPGDEGEGLGKVVNGKFLEPPESAFKRLHVLYLVHDVIMSLHNHPSHPKVGKEASLSQLLPDVMTLVQLAACRCEGKAAQTYPRVLELIALWKKHHVFNPEQLDQMRDKTILADRTGWDELLKKLSKDEEDKESYEKKLREDKTKWFLPETHCVPNDPQAPWHELPAANGLYMKRIRGFPLRANAFPQGGFRLRNAGKEADQGLKKDVTNLYNDVIRCYDKYTNADEVQDIDPLGNIIWKDPGRKTRNYWGFTLDGIEKRKKLARDFADAATGYESTGSFGGGRGVGIGRGARGGWSGGRGGWRGGRGW